MNQIPKEECVCGQSGTHQCPDLTAKHNHQIPNIEETNTREGIELIDYYMQSIRQIDGLRGMGRSTEKKITNVLFALITTQQQTHHQQLQKARVQEKMRIKTLLEDLPAFTPCSDKTMDKVADEAKKPAYLTNYLERETVLKLLDHSELDQAELEGGLVDK